MVYKPAHRRHVAGVLQGQLTSAELLIVKLDAPVHQKAQAPLGTVPAHVPSRCFEPLRDPRVMAETLVSGQRSGWKSESCCRTQQKGSGAAAPMRIPVPPGTVVKRKRGSTLLADLTHPGNPLTWG